MNRRRRTALAAAAVPALLLAMVVLAPLLFRDRIEARVQAEIGDRIAARVAWRGVGVSLLRDFPNLTFRLDDVVVSGIDRFAGDTLLAVPRFRMVLDLRSVLRGARGTGPVIVRSVALHEPVLRLMVLEDGTANWDIGPTADEAPRAGPARAVDLSLRRFEIAGGTLTLDDRQAGLAAAVAGLTHSLRGDFRQSRFDLRTHTAADAVSLRFAGVPYLSRARLDVRADLDVDAAAGRVTMRDNQIRLNELLLALSGSVAADGDDVVMDLAFSTPRTAFGDILSLVPAIYAHGFATLQTSGTMSVSGRVDGRYGAGEFPALAIAAKVEDGMFRYPELPLPARDIFMDVTVTNPGGHVDSTVVSLTRFNIVLGRDPIAGSFVMRTPVSDPDVDVSVTGRLDLADLARTVVLEGIDELAGVIVADAALRARLSDLDHGRYDAVTAGGSIAVSGLALHAVDLPHALHIDDALLRLTPSHAELAALAGRIGSSDIALDGRVDNLLGFMLRGEELRGEARLTSTRLDLEEWRSDDDVEAIAVPRNLDFAVEASVGRLIFGTLDMRNARGGLRVHEERLTLDDFRVDLLGGSMAMSGYYETVDPARPRFDVDVRMTDFDVAAAAASFATMRAFAPVASYTQGRFSADVRLNGPLGTDMAPVLEALSGLGSFRTANIGLTDFPAMDRLAGALSIRELAHPVLVDVSSTIHIRDGRLHVQPFDVGMGEITMRVSGSNGIDQSLDYMLALQVPRTALGAEADRVVARLIAQTSRAGLVMDAADIITLGVQLAGTVTDPSVTASFRDAAGSAAQGIEQALRQEAERRIDDVEQRLDAAADEARRQAQAEAVRLVAEAEQHAEAMRAEARALADVVRREGHEQADALVARASGAAARAAAQLAADRLRRESDDRAERIVREADTRANALVAEARQRAAGGGPPP
jgi:uncharacterized protein involved in outer membrane biogenesis